MRILKTFFFGLLWSTIASVVLFFIMREVLLYMAVAKFKGVARKVYSTQTAADFTRNCLDYGGVPTEGKSITQMQVRFVSDKDFVLEVVCQGASSVRQVLVDYSLPWLVRKEQGQSGLIRGADGTAVVLSVFNRKGLVYQEDGFIFSETGISDTDDYDFSSGPVTTCSGYGYGCCDQLFQIGEGTKETSATDCPKSCFPQCLSRPVVLNLKAIPLDPSGARKVTIKSGEEVTLYYAISDTEGDIFSEENLYNEKTIDDPDYASIAPPGFEEKILTLLDKYAKKADLEEKDNSIKEVLFDFGDGDQEIVSDLQGEVAHTYTCSRSSCQYVAKIIIKTNAGIENVPNELSMMRVNVSN